MSTARAGWSKVEGPPTGVATTVLRSRSAIVAALRELVACAMARGFVSRTLGAGLPCWKSRSNPGTASRQMGTRIQPKPRMRTDFLGLAAKRSFIRIHLPFSLNPFPILLDADLTNETR